MFFVRKFRILSYLCSMKIKTTMLFHCAPDSEYGENVRRYANKHWQNVEIVVHEDAFSEMVMGKPVFVLEKPKPMQFGEGSLYIDFYDVFLEDLIDMAKEFLKTIGMGAVIMLSDEDVLIVESPLCFP